MQKKTNKQSVNEIPTEPTEPVEPEIPEDKPANVSDSILSSVKKLVGILEEDDSFDLDIILNINAAFSVLYQLGVLEKPFIISSKEDTYQDLMPDGTDDVISLIKMYLVYKVRLGFDSATMSSGVMGLLKEMIAETEYRLMITYNPKTTFENETEEEKPDTPEEGGEIQNE